MVRKEKGRGGRARGVREMEGRGRKSGPQGKETGMEGKGMGRVI